ncbi:unnamed protein product, partial [Scytosiphon promiscuus]
STELRRAILRGAEGAIFDLICAETTTEQWSEWLRAPLEYAAGAGNLDLVTKLEGAGADGSALHVALRCGQGALARELLQRGACTKEKDASGDSPLHLAATLGSGDVVSLLLERGGPVDAVDSEGRTALHLAAERGSIPPVQALLEAGADLNLRYGNGDESALDLAAGGGHLEILNALVQQGADVNARNSKGCTALHAAGIKNKACAVDALIKAGANADVQGGACGLRWTPLHMACEQGSAEAVVALLNHGADVHRLGRTSWGGYGGRCSALHLAAYGGSVTIVNDLLDAGARLNLRESDSGDTALDRAASGGSAEVVKALIKHGARVDAVDSFGRTALFKAAAAATADDAGIIDALVEAGARACGAVDKLGMTPLHLVARGGSSKVAISLLSHGARVDVRDNEGNSPLHAACELGFAEGIPALLERGAHVNERNDQGRTPLALAAEIDDGEAIKLLLDAGADVNAPADFGDGSPALVLAVANDCADTITLLAQRGADVNAANDDGDTALHRAARGNHLRSVGALIAASADIESSDRHARTPLVAAFRSAFYRWKEEGEDSTPPPSTSPTLLHYCACLGCPLSLVQALLDAGADVDARDERGLTPLHKALERGRLDVFRTLLVHGADADARDPDGRAVLHRAAVADENRVDFVDDLISAGAATHTKDNEGCTPLHLAASHRRLDVMRVLLRSGADVASVNNEGRTALHLAVSAEGYMFDIKADDVAEIVDLLLRWGADENAVD